MRVVGRMAVDLRMGERNWIKSSIRAVPMSMPPRVGTEIEDKEMLSRSLAAKNQVTMAITEAL